MLCLITIIIFDWLNLAQSTEWFYCKTSAVSQLNMRTSGANMEVICRLVKICDLFQGKWTMRHRVHGYERDPRFVRKSQSNRRLRAILRAGLEHATWFPGQKWWVLKSIPLGKSVVGCETALDKLHIVLCVLRILLHFRGIRYSTLGKCWDW